MIRLPLLPIGPTAATGVTHPVSRARGVAIRIPVSVGVPVYVAVAVDVNVHRPAVPVAVVGPGGSPGHAPGEADPE